MAKDEEMKRRVPQGSVLGLTLFKNMFIYDLYLQIKTVELNTNADHGQFHTYYYTDKVVLGERLLGYKSVLYVCERDSTFFYGTTKQKKENTQQQNQKPSFDNLSSFCMIECIENKILIS